MRFIILILPLFSFICNQSKNNECLEGKIIRVTCATIVMQVLNNDTVGVDGWKDTMDPAGKSYNNVFSVSNKCDFSADYKAGQNVRFKKTTKTTDDCMVCMMYDAPPESGFAIEICK